MNEEVVELLVRLACGESAEPAVHGIAELEGQRFRVWKHGACWRVEELGGRLRAMREAERELTFHSDDDLPSVSEPLSFSLGDELTPWALLVRPRIDRLNLSGRRADVPVARGERFGRPTASLTLQHSYDDDPLTLVLDAVTGMPFEITGAGDPYLRWLELEVVEAIDDDLLRWDGETADAGWFGSVGSTGDVGDEENSHVPPEVREQFREGARRAARWKAELDLPTRHRGSARGGARLLRSARRHHRPTGRRLRSRARRSIAGPR